MKPAFDDVRLIESAEQRRAWRRGGTQNHIHCIQPRADIDWLMVFRRRLMAVEGPRVRVRAGTEGRPAAIYTGRRPGLIPVVAAHRYGPRDELARCGVPAGPIRPDQKSISDSILRLKSGMIDCD